MMIVQAYAALLLAFLSMERSVTCSILLFNLLMIMYQTLIVYNFFTSCRNSMKVRGDISSCLPNNNLKILVPVLEGFVVRLQNF
jgi:hypothetical protein